MGFWPKELRVVFLVDAVGIGIIEPVDQDVINLP
jgi:hypothetical protein